MDLNHDQEFYVQLPGYNGRGRSFGPFSCPEGADIACHLFKLSEAVDPLITKCPFRVKLPRNLTEHILTIAYPRWQRRQDGEPVIVYGIECEPNERMTEGEIKNRFEATYDHSDVIGERCFCMYSEIMPAQDQGITSGPRKSGRGTIFVAKYLESNSDSSSPPSSGPYIAPPTNLPLHLHNTSSQAPIVATSGPHKSGSYVMPNQNLVLPGDSPTTDDQRKIDMAQMDAVSSAQGLVSDRPHLEQKPPLQNLEDLAGCTGMQRALDLVTPSGEQSVVGGPLPCKDKPPTIVIHVTGKEEEGEGSGSEQERREEIVRPLSESSTSVSSSLKSASDRDLEPLHRENGLLGMVAPKFQKSHKGMVTGRTISLPPNRVEKQNSVENLCTGATNSQSILRTQSDLSTLVRRKDSSLKLLLRSGDTHSPSDNGNVESSEPERPRTRRRSMSDIGIQRQDSGGDLNEAVIAGVPKCLLVQNAKDHQSCLGASMIHESQRVSKGESEITKQSGPAVLSPEHAPLNPPLSPLHVPSSTNASDSVLSRVELQSELNKDDHQDPPSSERHHVVDTQSSSERRAFFRLGSINESPSQEEEEVISEDEEIGEGGASTEREVEERELEESSEEGTWSSASRSMLPRREVRQQAHIMEHAYNGKCILGDECPVRPTKESLRQMSKIIEDHRNCVLNATLTEFFKDCIRAHCSRCIDADCKVPHLAAGCPLPGTTDSCVSSSDPHSPTLSPLHAPHLPHQLHRPHQHQQRQQQQQVPYCSISVDLKGNMSTSEEVQRFQAEQQGTAQCAESAVHDHDHLGQCGANDTDHPLALPSSPFKMDGEGLAPTNGTPPDDVINPVVCPSSHLHPCPNLLPPRPNLLPGLLPQRQRGIAPIDAMTNDPADTKLLPPVPLQSSSLHNKRQVYGHVTDSLRSPIQQASDFENLGVLNRNQACYLLPARKAHTMFRGRHCQVSTSELPNVQASGFPHVSQYSSVDEGVLIYCSERLTNATDFSLGERGRPPNQHKSDVIGSGGNGSVYGYYQNGQMFAVKRTVYRQTELQAWLQLDHPNVLPLLGVMWGGQGGHHCFQFMPKMTSDLSSVMRSVGDLCTLVHFESLDQWENVLKPNISHVVKNLVCGVNYLHQKGVQHCDLKASNILINRKESCRCVDIFSCTCPPRDKCEIRIADFDSVKMFTPGRHAASVPDLPCEPKPSTVKVLGTPFYRAPEQFKQHSSHQQLYAEGLEGPWCDMWSIGVIVTQLCLGKPRAHEKEMVCRTMVGCPTTLNDNKNPTPEVEGFVARERLSTLRQKCIDCRQLAPLAEMAADCLEPDFKKRITAEKLLEKDFFLRA